MARKPKGHAVLNQAIEAIAQARTIEELRQAQAVALPLLYGLSMEQTAQMLGLSVSWACQLRSRFIQSGATHKTQPVEKLRRRRAHLSLQEEKIFLQPYFEQLRQGHSIVVAEVKRALENRLNHTVAVATVYNLLNRNGWHELAAENLTALAAKTGKKKPA